MSRIIKAKEQPAIKNFDFLAIEEDAGRNRFMGSAANGARTVAKGSGRGRSFTSDPLEELEETIQHRLLEVERRAQELEREAYEKGYAQGEKDGMEYGQKSMAVVKEHMERLLRELQSVPDRVLQDYRDWLITTCLAVARRVVDVELKTQPRALVKMIDALLSEAIEHQSLTLYLNPKDLDMLERTTEFQEWLKKTDRVLTVKPDAELARGGCRMESDIQFLDASMDTQFSLIEEALRHHGSSSDSTLPE